MEIYEPADDLQKALDDFNKDQVRGTAISEGKERFSLEDPEGLVNRFEQTLDKWRKLFDGVDRTDAEALKAVLRENLYSKVDENSYGL